MFTRKSLAVATLLATLGTLVLGGCASTGKADSSGEMAVMCPKCETIWTQESSILGPGKLRKLHLRPDMKCPSCDKQAAAFLQGDQKILHDCADCKGTPKTARTSSSWNAYKRGS